MRIETDDKANLEETLFHFLLSIRDGSPRAEKFLLTDEDTLHTLYDQPHNDLLRALHHCLDAFLVELSPEPIHLGNIETPSSTLGLALAVNNCLCPIKMAAGNDEKTPLYTVNEFTSAIIHTIPPALNRDAQLAYHAVLRGSKMLLSHIDREQKRLFSALLERSPLTQLVSLDIHMPVVLNKLASQILPAWKQSKGELEGVWTGVDEWIEAWVERTVEEPIARWLRHQWLEMPETEHSCRNTGLVLESLRKRGREQKYFILEFYEAYDYLCSEKQKDEWYGEVRVWSVLKTIEKLLHVRGNNEAAISLNRKGNAYFLKFLPLLKIIIEENGIPADFKLLSLEFIHVLRSLLDYTSYGVGQHISFGEVTFQNS